MFYDFVILRQQNEGRFALSWAAATRGIAHLTREVGAKRIREVNIFLLCEELMEYIQNTSSDPRKRFSLRLSTMLIRGVILLHQKQLSLFQDDLSKFFSKITIPIYIPTPPGEQKLTQRQFDTPPTPITKEKRKKRGAPKKQKPLGLDEFILLGELKSSEGSDPATLAANAATARNIAIDLVEAQPQPLKPADPFDDFGITAIEPLTVAPVQPVKPPSDAGSRRSQLEMIEEKLALEEMMPPVTLSSIAKLRRKRSSSSQEDQTKEPTRITVEVMLHQPPPEKTATDLPIPMEVDLPTSELQPMETVKIQRPSEEVLQRPSEEIRILEETPHSMQLIEAQRPSEGVQVVEEPPQSMMVVEVQEPLKEIQQMVEEPPRVKKLPRTVERVVAKSKSEQKRIKKKEQLIVARHHIDFKTRSKVRRIDETEQLFNTDAKEKAVYAYVEKPASILVGLRNFSMEKLGYNEVEGVLDLREDRARRQSSRLSSFPRMTKLTTSTSTPYATSSDKQELEQVKSADLLDIASMPIHIIGATPSGTTLLKPAKRLYEETYEEQVGTTQKLRMETEELVVTVPQIEQEIPLQEETPRIRESPESKSQRLRSTLAEEERKRRQNIIHTLKNWQPSQGLLTIDYLIPSPKNRLNAAKTFHDLLVLAKEGYVRLIPDEDTLEISSIEKGALFQ